MHHRDARQEPYLFLPPYCFIIYIKTIIVNKKHNMNNILIITNMPNNFYSLYSDGIFEKKHFDKDTEITALEYKENSAVLLYYTYPVHRRVYLVRNVSYETKNLTGLPGLSKKVKIIFKNTASRVDKTRRAFAHIREHYGDPFAFPDDYYTRLDFLIKQKGKIKYHLIDMLTEKYI
jgi:hypothetical protein